jgi:hypothetical protein
MKTTLKTIRKGFFPSLIALSALSVSISAAFYSVTGLSKLFAGASIEVIIMAGSLEAAKLVIASLLYQYWHTLNKYLRTYLSIATVVLILITSMGIYGFLSAAYQDTYRQLSLKDNKTAFITQKKDFYAKDVNRYDQELERISNNISALSNARSQSIQVRDTSVAGGIRTTISTSEIRMAQSRIKTEEENRKLVQAKREVAADSLQKFQFQILELDNNLEVAGELGPLQYLSGLTGMPMDKIINILLLIIIFVFDPLAIALVVAANFAFDKAFEKNLYGEYSDTDSLYDDDDEDDYPLPNDDLMKAAREFEVAAEEILPDEARGFAPPTSEDPLLDYDEEDEKRMNIVGQNGNDGEHYGEVPLDTAPNPKPKDTEEDWEIAFESDKRVAEILQKTPSKRRVRFMDGTEGWINRSSGSDDDNTISYM